MGKRTLKVALVVGGGVSLGSFNGGALAEIVRQLSSNLNRDRWQEAKIDVLFGASAGGMTLGLLVRALTDPGNVDVPTAVNRVRKFQEAAWVTGIDVRNLISNPAAELAGIMDRRAIDELASRLMAWPAGQAPCPILLARRVCLGITLLNYNGIPIRASEVPALSDAMSTTLYRDYRVFCLDFKKVAARPPSRWKWYESDEVNQPDAWKEITATAIAGGAFPLAFEPVVIERSKEEYGPLWPRELRDRAAFPFTFGDGGTFNNEPLREAMQIIGFMDAREKTDSYDRVLLYIDPNLTGTSHDFSLSFHVPFEVNPDFGPFDKGDVVPAEAGAKILRIAGRFVGSVLGQAAFQDFLEAEKINNRLAWRNTLREFLTKIVGPVSPTRAQEAMTLLQNVLTEKRAGSITPATSLAVDEELNRVSREETGQKTGTESLSPRDQLLYCLFSLIDQVAALRGKETVNVIAIGPTAFQPKGNGQAVRVELAGNFLGNFGGFFDPAFRRYDFAAGEAMAGSALATTEIGDTGQEVPLLKNSNDRPDYQKWPGNDPTFDNLPQNKKAAFTDRIGKVLKQIVHNQVPIVVVRDLLGALAKYFLRKRIVGLAGGAASGEAMAWVRLKIVPADPAGDEFYLVGQEKGDDTAYAKAGSDGMAELDTLVFFSTVNTTLSGPHVVRRNDRYVLELAERRVLWKDDRLEVTLPDFARLATGDKLGLAVHTAQIQWLSRSQGAWQTDEALTALAKTF